jgi:DHA2 family multidrug resistance protein
MPVADQVTGRQVQSKWLILVALAGTGWALLSGSRLTLDIGF